jgi:hypothetical protein
MHMGERLRDHAGCGDGNRADDSRYHELATKIAPERAT